MAASFPSRSALLVVAALLCVPGVAANHLPGGADHAGEHVLEHRAFVLTVQSDTGIVAETIVDVPATHTWTRINGTSILEIRVSLVVNSGGVTNPTADFRVLWDGAPVSNCMWHIEGGTVTGGRFNPHVSLFCQLPEFVESGEHTIEIERTAVTGTPISETTTSIILFQTETVIMDINISNLELWIPIVVSLGLVLLGVLMGFDFAVAGGVIALVASMFLEEGVLGVEPWEFAITFALLGIVGEYVAYRRQDQLKKRRAPA